MAYAAEFDQQTSAGQGSGPDLALLLPLAPATGLTPAQHLLRRLVLDSDQWSEQHVWSAVLLREQHSSQQHAEQRRSRP